MPWEGLKEYIEDLKSIPDSTPNLQQEYLQRLGQITVELFQQNSPKKTGSFAFSWHIMELTNTSVTIGTGQTDKFNYLAGGIRAHTITGNPVLRFEIDGETIYARKVEHPGTTADPFFDDIVDMVLTILEDTFDSIIARHYKLFAHVSGKGISPIRRGRFKATRLKPFRFVRRTPKFRSRTKV